MIKSIFPFLIVVMILSSSCSSPIRKDQVVGCWTVAYIDTDGIKMKGGIYQMCFEENGVLITQKKDGTEKVKAEWNIIENDSLIILHYDGGSMPDTAKILKFEADQELHMKMRKGQSLITLYLRKDK